MNKAELKKIKIKMILEMLINEYEAEVKNAGGGIMDVVINGHYPGQFNSRDLKVTLKDASALKDDGSSKYEQVKYERALDLETAINDDIKYLIEQVDDQFA
jgi:hypothetical protein